MNEQAIIQHIDSMAEKAVAIRRDLHKYAEAGWVEYRTTCFIVESLEKLGIPTYVGEDILAPEAIMGRPDESALKKHQERALAQGTNPEILTRLNGYTGVMGVIETGKKGPVIAMRFDIDSNDANETHDCQHRPNQEGFASVNAGFQHACGHDGHTAIGLLCAEALMAVKDQLCGTIKLIFQPAEEGVRGAVAMAERGLLEDVDYYFSGHLINGALGTLYCGGYGMLATNKFDVEFIGRSAHAGASPQEGKNALLAAASATLALQSIVQDSRGAARVNVGVLQAGAGRNVIPDYAFMKVETRGDNNDIATDVFQKSQAILEGAAKMYGVELKVRQTGASPTAVSDSEIIALIRKVAEEQQLAHTIHDIRKSGGSDDSAVMMLATQKHGGQATYMMWGADTKAPGHNSYFDFDEAALTFAAKTSVLPVYRLLTEPN